MHLSILLLAITLGIPALAQPSLQSASSANLHRSTTELVSPATPATGVYFDHVVTIIMENQGVYDICKTSPPPCSTTGPAPYMAGLANNYTIGAQYLSLIETSQPNYVALISSSTPASTSSGLPLLDALPMGVPFEPPGCTWTACTQKPPQT